MSELFTKEEQGIIPVIDSAVNRAMAVHICDDKQEAKDIDFSEMTDEEFLQKLQSSDRKPLNPVRVCREALGYPAGTPIRDIMQGLRDAHQALVNQYLEHGVDPHAALQAVGDIIDHTEAYITGYSRVLGSLANKFMLFGSQYNALHRWIGKIWVPEEDGHDRTLTMARYATDDSMEEYSDDHIHHMQVGMHVPVARVLPTVSYLRGQEGATTESYRNYEKLLGPVLSRIPRRIGSDEARHTRLYGVVEEANLEALPEQTVVAIESEHDTFDMPGKEGINDFTSKAKFAGVVGLLDPILILRAQRARVMRLGLAKLNLRTDDAKRALEVLADPNGKYGDKKLGRYVRAMESLRERAIDEARKKNKPLPAIIGVTVNSHPRTGELSFPLSA